jgi:hypothetical protein
MQVVFGRRVAVEEKLNAKGSTPNSGFQGRVTDPFILVFYA